MGPNQKFSSGRWGLSQVVHVGLGRRAGLRQAGQGRDLHGAPVEVRPIACVPRGAVVDDLVAGRAGLGDAQHVVDVVFPEPLVEVRGRPGRGVDRGGNLRVVDDAARLQLRGEHLGADVVDEVQDRVIVDGVAAVAADHGGLPVAVGLVPEHGVVGLGGGKVEIQLPPVLGGPRVGGPDEERLAPVARSHRVAAERPRGGEVVAGSVVAGGLEFRIVGAVAHGRRRQIQHCGHGLGIRPALVEVALRRAIAAGGGAIRARSSAEGRRAGGVLVEVLDHRRPPVAGRRRDVGVQGRDAGADARGQRGTAHQQRTGRAVVAELRVDRVQVVRAAGDTGRTAVVVVDGQAHQAAEPHRARVIEDHADVAGPAGCGGRGLQVRRRQQEDLGETQVLIDVGRHDRLDHGPVLAGGQRGGKLPLELLGGGVIGVTADVHGEVIGGQRRAQEGIGRHRRLRVGSDVGVVAVRGGVAVEGPRRPGPPRRRHRQAGSGRR